MEGSNIYSDLWLEYRRIIMHSIVTSFGLDFIVHDQTGGDVDTIHSVRSTNTFKNPTNADAYSSRGEYDSVSYHHNDAYDSTVRAARSSQSFFDDAYVPGNRIFYGKASGLGTEHRANLDHVISAHEIHDDPGRVLAGVDGVEAANTETNLQFTNEHLNKSMGDMSIEEYIQWRAEHGKPLPEDVIRQMREKDSAARQEYERRLNEAYYSSNRFLTDVGIAAAKRGLEMSLRQALGFVFIEIWCACEDELNALQSGISLSDCAQAIATGIKNGVENARKNYKNLITQLEQGFLAGAIASLTTSLINIFITTDINTVRYIRQAYVTIVQVGNILLINPDDLRLGDQLKAATVSLATGTSVIAGTAVGIQIAKTPIGQNPEVGKVVQSFCSSLVSGLLSCTILVMIDRSLFIGELVEKMNSYGTVDHEMREVSAYFASCAAELKQYNISEFAESVIMLNDLSKKLIAADDDELHDLLLNAFDAFAIPLPWDGTFDEFMNDENTILVFD